MNFGDRMRLLTLAFLSVMVGCESDGATHWAEAPEGIKYEVVCIEDKSFISYKVPAKNGGYRLTGPIGDC